tara:strand:+ start:114 stop:797 length:684 start_codon:yes stop_codon:yes gene_type:complete
MQLSEDGNYMWNGDEWVPVEQAPVISETEPVEVQTPETTLATTPVPTVVSTPAVTPMVQNMGGKGTSGLDFTRGFSTLKYGLAAFLSTILTVILIIIVNGIIFYVALSGADDVEGFAVGFVVSMIICVLFNILAVTQVLTLVMGMGISDGLDKPGLGYIGSWKTAFTAILESTPVILTSAIMAGAGIGMLEDSPGVGGLLIFISGVVIMLFQMGLLAFMARKIATDL